jgi:CDP-diacylglycerol--serine O-phosphatidyltransferase
MTSVRFFRYLAPNLVTSLGLIFGLLSMVATFEGRYVAAAWLIIWAVLLDRVDGLVARTLKATSAFGVQMDSFADAINFGVAPAFLVYVSLTGVPALGFGAGPGKLVLLLGCGAWALGAVFRLAKFNVVTEDAGSQFFFGVPTTLAAGILVIWYIALHKYSAPGRALGSPEVFTDPKLFGDWTLPIATWAYLPAAMLLGALLMVSNLPNPKLRSLRYRALNVILVIGVMAGYICGFARVMPDFMMLLPTGWLLIALIWGQLSADARGLRPPPVLPQAEPTVFPVSAGQASDGLDPTAGVRGQR